MSSERKGQTEDKGEFVGGSTGSTATPSPHQTRRGGQTWRGTGGERKPSRPIFRAEESGGNPKKKSPIAKLGTRLTGAGEGKGYSNRALYGRTGHARNTRRAECGSRGGRRGRASRARKSALDRTAKLLRKLERLPGSQEPREFLELGGS